MRVREDEARTLLLIQAVEDTDQDGVLLSPRTRAAATRRVFDDAAPLGAGTRPTDDQAKLRARATLLRDELIRGVPAFGRVLSPPRARGALIVGTLVIAFVGGALTNLLGPERRISVLAFPLAGIVLWNLAVYALLIARALARVARRHGEAPRRRWTAVLAGWLEAARLSQLARQLGARTHSAAVTSAVARFERLWLDAAAGLVAARARVVLHLAALAMAVGAVIGLYVSGLAFEYRATWESTWLDARNVQSYVDFVLAPASRVLGIPVPDVTPLRGPAGDGDARPWIHLWATTLALFVVIPRGALALIDALTAARLARWLPVELDAAYTRRALHSGRGAATVVEIVYYSSAPDTALRERLHEMLQEQAGARAVIRDGARLEYGDGPERLTFSNDAPGAGMLAVVFALAQTPEPEVHGEFLAAVRDKAHGAGWTIQVVLETATYRRRVGSAERVRERRATWDRLLREAELDAIELADS